MTTSDSDLTGTLNTWPKGYDPLLAPKAIYVHAMLTDGNWMAAGRLEAADQAAGLKQTRLVYGQRWRRSPHAYALGPLGMELGGDLKKPLFIEVTPKQADVHGVFQDALPDRFGRRLFQESFAELQASTIADLGLQGRQRPRLPTTLDHLLLGDDDRVGAFRFSVDGLTPHVSPVAATIRDLPILDRWLSAFDRGEKVPRAVRRLGAGTSLGGARPKATVRLDDGSLWIAKFPRRDDTFDMVRAEHAAMTLARCAGCLVAETRVVPMGQREVLLVRRFDRDGDLRIPFASTLSLLGMSETSLGGSYPAIADNMRLANCPAGDMVELFRRMVFNAAIGNTDDHLKNHALLHLGGQWRLSPAFDVVPTPEGMDFQAIGIGVSGGSPDRVNLLSQAPRFGLDASSALAILDQVLACTATWRQHFSACGISDANIEYLARCIGRPVPPPNLGASLGRRGS